MFWPALALPAPPPDIHAPAPRMPRWRWPISDAAPSVLVAGRAAEVLVLLVVDVDGGPPPATFALLSGLKRSAALGMRSTSLTVATSIVTFAVVFGFRSSSGLSTSM